MKAAYVDTSCLVAVAFGEPGSARMVSRLKAYDVILASRLVEAEEGSLYPISSPISEIGILVYIRHNKPAEIKNSCRPVD